MTLLPRKYESRDSFSRMMDEMMRLPDYWEDTGLNQLRGVAGDVYETENEVVVEMAVPGIRPEDIKINVTGDVLTVSGEHKEEEKTGKREYYQKQLRYGSFAQSISLPSSVESEEADAHFEHGILKVVLPKREEAKPKQIQVKIK